MKPSDSKEYKRLAAQWEAKLEAEGMPAEIVTELSRSKGCVWRGKEEYYRLAADFLRELEVSDMSWPATMTRTSDAAVWARHTEGLSVRHISKILGISKDAIFRRIQRLRAEMLERYLE